VVQLMAALLAGLGLDVLRKKGLRGWRWAAAAFVVLVVAEYAVPTSALSRDVLPTPIHRWLVEQGPGVRALDCVPQDTESSSIPWLTGGQIAIPDGPVGDCFEPHLADKLAALGYTHLILRRGSPVARWFDAQPSPAGLGHERRLRNGRSFDVLASRPPIYTGTMRGFYPREFEAMGSGSTRSWRWASDTAVWEIVNTTAGDLRVILGVELQAFLEARDLEILLDAQVQQVLHVAPEWRWYETTTLRVPAGNHALTFRARQRPTIADAATQNGDPRPLTVAFGAWNWREAGDR
jgi:hypothetical protein